MKYSTLQIEIQVPHSEDGYVFDVGSLYDYLLTLTDKRKARGKRYELALILVLMAIAKLAGEDTPYGIADWVRARGRLLAQVFQRTRETFPGHNTYRRVLGQVVDMIEFEVLVGKFLSQWSGVGQSVLIALDGKTLRGTIARGQTRGVHLLAAYLPREGIVLFQVAVESKTNEIGAAPQVLKALDLRGKLVRGDALLTQRELSVEIVEAKGDYLWIVKDNQPRLLQDIQRLFQPESNLPGTSAPPKDFRTSRTVDKGHGRLEERTLTTSSLLHDYLDGPFVEQVFQLARRRINLLSGTVEEEVVYGLTSLTAQEASPAELLRAVRDYWGIENGLHGRRDTTFHEDATRMTTLPRLAEGMAILNNLVIGLLALAGHRNMAAARRRYSGHLPEALKLVLCRPG
jgi:predicted transposase YbfD/YdcC